MRVRTAFLIVLLSLTHVAGVASAEDAGTQQSWTINLKDAELGEFIDQVSRITGRNFVVDPRVKGRVTVVSTTALDANGVWELFQGVLRVHGFAAVPAGEVFQVVQQSAAKERAPLADAAAAGGEAIVTRVISVDNVEASDLVSALRPLSPQYAHVAALEAANAVIVSDHAENIRRMEALVAELDSRDEEGVEVVMLKEAWVENMVEMLETLAPNDIGPGATGPQAIQVVANTQTNALVLRGRTEAIGRMRGLIEQLDQPATVTGSTHVYRLSHSDAEEVAATLQQIMEDGDGADGSGAIGTRIHADTSLNAVVVRADPATILEINEVLDQLDVRRTQVLIEAAIVEVSMIEGREIGVDFAAVDRSGGTVPLIVSPLGRALQSLLGSGADIVEGASSLVSPTLAVARLSQGLSFAAILQAIGRHSDSDLLSTPSILTLDNEEATIVVGQNVPFRTGTFTTTGDGARNPFTTIQREDVGITLRVVPHIHDGDSVRLEVEQEVSAVEPDAGIGDDGFSDIVTSQRTINTTVLADDGQTIVLGGLIQDDIQETQRRVPVLSSLPLAGRLFRSTQTDRTKRNLLVFLRPTVLKTPDDVAAVSGRKYRSVWDVQSRRRGDDDADRGAPDMESVFEGRKEPDDGDG